MSCFTGFLVEYGAGLSEKYDYSIVLYLRVILSLNFII